MSNRLPYEDYLKQQWQDIPLPAEDPAWLDMKRRLDEDEDDGIIVWWRRGCLGWGIGLLLLIALGWWLSQTSGIFKTNKTGSEQTESKISSDKTSSGVGDSLKNDSSTIDQKLNKRNSVDPAISNTTSATPIDTSIAAEDIGQRNKRTILEDDRNKPSDINKKNADKSISSSQKIIDRGVTSVDSHVKTESKIEKGTKTQLVNKQNSVKKNKIADNRNKTNNTSLKKQNPTENIQVENKSVTDNKNDQSKTSIIPSDVKSDTTTVIPNRSIVENKPKTPDTLTTAKKTQPVIQKPQSKDSTIQNKQPKTKEKFTYFSAGVAVNQQLPLFGQKFTPYNAQGRKGSLLDYIPSIYARFNKSEKWFVQSEFRYGAPQYTKEILYDKKIELDPLGRPVSTLHTVKKTYYHQVPVSFNYYLFKNFSIGAGVIANKFNSAVFDERVVVPDNATQADSLISSGVFLSKKEKAFSKFYMQALFETQFKWKRFSLGGRYSFGLQPYLKFTLPGVAQQTEKNQAGQLFLRYEFFRSKKKYR